MPGGIGALMFGVFDGHGKRGEETSEFLRLCVPPFFAEHVPCLCSVGGVEAETAENEVTRAFEELNRALYGSGIKVDNAGSTAMVAAVCKFCQQPPSTGNPVEASGF